MKRYFIYGLNDYERFKNIRGKWKPSTFFPFSLGNGKPPVVGSLVWGSVFYNKVVIGEMGNGKGYHIVQPNKEVFYNE